MPDLTPTPMAPASGPTPLSAPPSRRATRHLRWRWYHTVLAVIAVLVVAAVIASRIDLDYYALTPGLAQPVGPLVKVQGASHKASRNVLLTDVFVTRVTALDYPFFKLDGDAQVLPAQTVLGPDTPPSQLITQGYLEMAQSQAAAKAAALTQLGYAVPEHDAGVIVFAVQPTSPASHALSVGQTITAVDGVPTTNACTFAQSLAHDRAGQQVTLTVERTTVTPDAVIRPGSSVQRVVQLARWPASVPRPASTPSCPGVAGADRGYLGIEAQTQQDFAYPVKVSIDTQQIGGPSAGLAMTLGVIEALSSGKLTGGKTAAATGTIAPTGAVGPVGGVREKTVAVERAGATVFFVPASERATALAKATPSLHVYGVRSLSQVLSDLRRLGGDVPAASVHGS